MKYRPIGSSSLIVSQVGLGTNNFGTRTDADEVRRIIFRAIELGVTLFDTAESYGGGASEEIIGSTLGNRRKEVLIATKWGIGGLNASATREVRVGSRDYIARAVEGSLKRLNTDYIDLFQFHRPDPFTSIEETLHALDDLIREGKVRYIGVSNMPAGQIEEAQLIARRDGRSTFVSFQDEYSVIMRDVERTLFPVTNKYNMGLLPYRPLANGLLSGKYSRNAPLAKDAWLSNAPPARRERYLNEKNYQIVESLSSFAQSRGRTLLELAVSWLVTQPQVASVIASASKLEQLSQNVAAADWALSPADLSEIDRLSPISSI